MADLRPRRCPTRRGDRPPTRQPTTRLGRFITAAGEADLDALQRHAERDPAWFWAPRLTTSQLAWQRRPTQTLDLARGPEWSRWWTGGAFNYAAAAVDPRAAADPDGRALTWEGEDGEVRRFTNAELKAQVDRAAAMFARLGVGEGDRVGIFLPLLPETVVSVLATRQDGRSTSRSSPAMRHRRLRAGSTTPVPPCLSRPTAPTGAATSST